MTVKCIDEKGTTGITLGKEYEVKKAAKGFFHIVNDTGVTLAYDKVRFKADKKAAKPKTTSNPSKGKSDKKAAKPEKKSAPLAKTEKPEIINKAEYSKRLETSTANIRKEIGGMAKGFVKIGYELYRVREGKLYLGQDYKNIYEYGEKAFGFQKSSIANYISICERFSVLKDKKPTAQLNPAYANYGYGQLSLMLSLPAEKLSEITPDKTCSEIRDTVKAVKIKSQLTSKTPAPKSDKKAASPDSKNPPVPIKVFNVYWDFNGDEVKKTSFTLRDGENVNKELLLLLKNDWFDFGRDGDSLKIELARDVKTSSGDSQ